MTSKNTCHEIKIMKVSQNNPSFIQSINNQKNPYLILKVHQICPDCFTIGPWHTIPQRMLSFNNFIPVNLSTQQNIIQYLHHCYT